MLYAKEMMYMRKNSKCIMTIQYLFVYSNTATIVKGGMETKKALLPGGESHGGPLNTILVQDLIHSF